MITYLHLSTVGWHVALMTAFKREGAIIGAKVDWEIPSLDISRLSLAADKEALH